MVAPGAGRHYIEMMMRAMISREMACIVGARFFALFRLLGCGGVLWWHLASTGMLYEMVLYVAP